MEVLRYKAAFLGVGIAMAVAAATKVVYYQCMVGWGFYYLIDAAKSIFHYSSGLSWLECDHPWNTDLCWPVNDSSITGRIQDSAAYQFFK